MGPYLPLFYQKGTLFVPKSRNWVVEKMQNTGGRGYELGSCLGPLASPPRKSEKPTPEKPTPSSSRNSAREVEAAVMRFQGLIGA